MTDKAWEILAVGIGCSAVLLSFFVGISLLLYIGAKYYGDEE